MTEESSKPYQVSQRVDERVWLVSIVAMGAGLWLWFRWRTGIRLEDALITFRVARNLADGHGFVYNLGERALGTTTPLLALMLGGCGWLFGSRAIPFAATLLLMTAGVCCGPLLFSILKQLGVGFGAAMIAVMLFYADPRSVWAYTGGMETPLVVCLMMLALLLLVTNRPIAAGIASALLLLARIDGAVWVALLYAGLFVYSRRDGVRSLCALALTLAPWLIFSIFYFGSPVPHTVIAKQMAGRVSFTDLLRQLQAYRGDLYVPTATAYEGVLLLAAGIYAVARHRRWTWLLLAAYPFVFAVTLSVGRAPSFAWYMVPTRWCSLAIASIGIVMISERVASSMRSKGAWRYAGAVALLVLLAWGDAAAMGRSIALRSVDQSNEDGLRRVAGLWLKDHAAANASVGTEAIGYQGYYSERRIIDLAGLVSPQVVAIRRRSADSAEMFHAVLEELRPDYLVLRSFEVDTNAAFGLKNGGPLFTNQTQREYFSCRYVEVARLSAPNPTAWAERGHLTIYRRAARSNADAD